MARLLELLEQEAQQDQILYLARLHLLAVAVAARIRSQPTLELTMAAMADQAAAAHWDLQRLPQARLERVVLGTLRPQSLRKGQTAAQQITPEI